MLDENLPTFRLRPSADNPLSSIFYFTRSGSDPSAEYLLRRADPALPGSGNKYDVALCDPYNQDVVYSEVLVEPEWTQPTLSAAEIRAQAQPGAAAIPVTPVTPDSFSVHLYNPDYAVAVKMVTGGFAKSDSWEFEMPVQTFSAPTTSELDREQRASPPAAGELIPRIMFRWKRDGRISKDLTCYMSGKNLGGRKNNEPDITIALLKTSRESALTIYEPNLHRVEVEDRKGLELVLLLTAEVIKDLYLMPRPDVFNTQGGGPLPSSAARKNSRPAATSSPGPAAPMSGALSNIPPQQQHTPPAAASNMPPSAAAIDAEARRLQAQIDREQREREKAERAEQKRIKRMLEEEERERLRREAEVAKETERLRKKYGTEGQELPSDRPPLPPRTPQPPPHMQPQAQHKPPPPATVIGGGGLTPGQWGAAPPPSLPPRPLSAGPFPGPPRPKPSVGQPTGGPFHCQTLNQLWRGAEQVVHNLPLPPPHMQGSQRPTAGGGGRRDDRGKMRKKRSSEW